MFAPLYGMGLYLSGLQHWFSHHPSPGNQMLIQDHKFWFWYYHTTLVIISLVAKRTIVSVTDKPQNLSGFSCFSEPQWPTSQWEKRENSLGGFFCFCFCFYGQDLDVVHIISTQILLAKTLFCGLFWLQGMLENGVVPVGLEGIRRGSDKELSQCIYAKLYTVANSAFTTS